MSMKALFGAIAGMIVLATAWRINFPAQSWVTALVAGVVMVGMLIGLAHLRHRLVGKHE